MSFMETVEKARALLERNGRVSLRALQREFDLDEDALDELIEELVEIQRVAERDGRALAWAGGRPAPLETTESERAPRDYTPKHLADKILQTKSALEGERKQITVLFADVKGSMALSEGLDPEAWHGILNRFLEILADGVHRFEGTVNQYTGDGIMALFGAPLAHEDHAQRACFAALHLQDALRGYADEIRLSQGLSLFTRMGINSGEVVVGKIGDDLRMDYTAQGHSVGLAQRMEQLAEPGKVYLTQHTAALVEGYFTLRDLGETEVRGVAAPVRVSELQGLGRMRTRLDRARARGLSRFVGRQKEMIALEDALERSLAGNGQVVGVVADAGTGKSRLCAEFVERCRARNVLVREAHCPAHGSTMPFLPVLELMRSIFGVEQDDGEREARRKIAGELTLLGPELAELLPVVTEFLGVPDRDQPALELSAEARQRKLYAFVRHLVHARSERELSVTFLDDLHWIDVGSDAFFAQLIEAIPETRTLVLVNFRPEYQADWMQKSYYQQLPLVPLGPEDIRELLTDLLGTHPSVADLPARVHERTGGNPFFAEELIQSLIESGGLAGTRGAYELTRPADDLEIPTSVHGVLAARIDRLGEREKQVLQTASVIGKEFSGSVLEAVVDLSADELASALATLQRGEFLFEKSLYPEVEYVFKHPLTQEVADGSQLQESKARVHAAVAREIERAQSERLDESAALLAHHWEEAGEALAAARWHRRAAEWVGLNNVPEALEHWRRVASLADRDEHTPETLDLALASRAAMLPVGLRAGVSLDEAETLFQEGLELSGQAGDSGRRAMILCEYMVYRVIHGSVYDEVRHLTEEAARLVADISDTDLQIAVSYRVAWLELICDHYAQAQPALEDLLARARANPHAAARLLGFDLELKVGGFLFFARGMRGEIQGSIQEIDRLVPLCAAAGDAESEISALTWRIQLTTIVGDESTATAHAGRLLALCEETGSKTYQPMLYFALGLIDLWRERFAEARHAFENVWCHRSSGLFEASAYGALAVALLEDGEPERARQLSDQSIEDQRRGARMWSWHTYLLRAEFLRRSEGSGACDEIERVLGKAAELIETAGAVAMLPFLNTQRAHLARLEGDSAAWQRELDEARRSFEQMGAPARVAWIDELAAEFSS